MESGAELVRRLQGICGHEQVLTHPDALATYRSDGLAHYRQTPLAAALPGTGDEVREVVRACFEAGVPWVARGSGTGLAGGAVPLDGPVVVVTTKMNRVLSVDTEARVAWVEPGLLNLDLSKAVARHGLHFAPDPSSQQSCSIGGNISTNAGGPHCLAYGVTSTHVLAVEVVLPDGTVTMLGGLDPEPAGLDLRGAFVGGEGMLGIATRIAVRLMPNPPAVRQDSANACASLRRHSKQGRWPAASAVGSSRKNSSV